jgi:hypothetical protein
MALQDIPADLLPLLEELQRGGEASLLQPVLAEKLRDMRDMRDTAMPKATTALGQDRFGTIIGKTSPLEYIASTMKQIQGGQGVRDTEAGMRQGVGDEARAYKAMMMARLLREYPEKGPAPTGVVGGLPTPPGAQGIPFAQTPPWEEPYFPGMPEEAAPPPKKRVGPPAPTPAMAGRGYGTTY